MSIPLAKQGRRFYNGAAMLNYIWLALVVLAALVGGFGGRMKETVDGAVTGAESAVTLAVGLVGIMALWLGLMRLAEKAGLVQRVAAWLRPVLRRLFPDVPAEHPAMGSMLMNIAANMLGLNNAATPLGLRAMRDLETLNPHPGTATNAMCTFLAINTSSVQLIPMTAVAILAAKGSANPSAIIGTAFLATVCSTAAGIAAVKLLEKLPLFRLATASSGTVRGSSPPPMGEDQAPPAIAAAPMPRWGLPVLLLFGSCFVWFALVLTWPEVAGRAPSAEAPPHVAVRAVNALSLLAIPFLIAFFPLYAALRRLPVYEVFIEGAKEGFHVAVRIIPYLVGMLVAIGMFRGAGGVDLMTRALRPMLEGVGFPAELVPMALMRPLSGSGSLAILSDLAQTHGADHILSRMAATILGSTETTFYVIAVYFGSVGIDRTRHAIPAGLVADAVGIAASVIICRLAFG
ncbi:MAG TPA: nucleoside recognition domain-containing protein [Methylomirabilota bacterium]|nr:nucleoside recognition domain-containing protein [Methylomirabilota bacterium]